MLKLKRVSPEIKEYSNELSEATKAQDRKRQKFFSAKRTALLKRIGASQVAVLANILTVPFYIGFFMALRKVIYYPEMYNLPMNDSFLWMASGTLPDPYFLLPLFTGLSTYFAIEYSTKQNSMSTSMPLIVRKMKVLMPLIPVFSLVTLSAFPAGFSAYLMTIGLANLFNIWLFQTKLFAKINGIPAAYPDTKEFFNLARAEQVEILQKFGAEVKQKAVPLEGAVAAKQIAAPVADRENLTLAPNVKVNTANLAQELYRSFALQKTQPEPQILTTKLTREALRQSRPKRSKTAVPLTPLTIDYKTISDVKVFAHKPMLKPNKQASNPGNNSL